MPLVSQRVTISPSSCQGFINPRCCGRASLMAFFWRPLARLRLSLNDKFIAELVLIVRRARKVLGQNLTAAFDGPAVGIARVSGF